MCNHTQPAPTGETGNPLTRRRIHFLDEVRGLDILLMVIYHVFYMAGWVFNLSWGRTLFLFFRPVAPFFAGIFVFLCGISCHLSHNNWKRGGMLALIAIGVFISSLTESQVIAAVASFAVMMGLMLIDTLSSVMPTQFLQDLVYGLSFYTRYANFTLGLLNIADVIFFLSVSGLFIFFTVRVLEKKRWS